MRDGLGSCVILVVDDEAFARLFAVQVFLDEGFTVLEASDAAEGLQMLDCNDDISLLFTDVSMPGDLDGLDLIRHVRAARPEIAVLVTSGHDLAAQDAGLDGAPFLPKPYTAHALMASIRSLVTAEAPLVR